MKKLLILFFAIGIVSCKNTEKKSAENIIQAIEKTLEKSENRTRDLKGTANTVQCAEAVLNNI